MQPNQLSEVDLDPSCQLQSSDSLHSGSSQSSDEFPINRRRPARKRTWSSEEQMLPIRKLKSPPLRSSEEPQSQQSESAQMQPPQISENHKSVRDSPGHEPSQQFRSSFGPEFKSQLWQPPQTSCQSDLEPYVFGQGQSQYSDTLQYRFSKSSGELKPQSARAPLRFGLTDKLRLFLEQSSTILESKALQSNDRLQSQSPQIQQPESFDHSKSVPDSVVQPQPLQFRSQNKLKPLPSQSMNGAQPPKSFDHSQSVPYPVVQPQHPQLRYQNKLEPLPSQILNGALPPRHFDLSQAVTNPVLQSQRSQSFNRPQPPPYQSRNRAQMQPPQRFTHCPRITTPACQSQQLQSSNGGIQQFHSYHSLNKAQMQPHQPKFVCQYPNNRLPYLPSDQLQATGSQSRNRLESSGEFPVQGLKLTRKLKLFLDQNSGKRSSEESQFPSSESAYIQAPQISDSSELLVIDRPERVQPQKFQSIRPPPTCQFSEGREPHLPPPYEESFTSQQSSDQLQCHQQSDVPKPPTFSQQMLKDPQSPDVSLYSEAVKSDGLALQSSSELPKGTSSSLQSTDGMRSELSNPDHSVCYKRSQSHESLAPAMEPHCHQQTAIPTDPWANWVYEPIPIDIPPTDGLQSQQPQSLDVPTARPPHLTESYLNNFDPTLQPPHLKEPYPNNFDPTLQPPHLKEPYPNHFDPNLRQPHLKEPYPNSFDPSVQPPHLKEPYLNHFDYNRRQPHLTELYPNHFDPNLQPPHPTESNPNHFDHILQPPRLSELAHSSIFQSREQLEPQPSILRNLLLTSRKDLQNYT